MKVLIASLFVDPNSKGSGSNVYNQSYSLKFDHNLNIEILTNPFIGNWNFSKNVFHNNFILTQKINGINYHLIDPDYTFDTNNICSNVLDIKTWNNAVKYGIKLLKHIKPDILHLQHRHSFWWLLESAQILGIKTIYSAHDWGIACQRTVLIKGDGTLCDGQINISNCSKCILAGRSSLGRINESLANNFLGKYFLIFLFKTPLKSYLHKYNIIKIPVSARVKLNIDRLNSIFSKINFIIVPQKWGINFFSQFDIENNKLISLNWFSTPKIQDKKNISDTIIISYVGRISHEKNIEVLLESLYHLETNQNIIIKITGNSDKNEYSNFLQLKYGNKIKNCTIEWIKWINPEDIYNISDCILVITGCMEGGPTTLYEAFSYKLPVIATNIPTIAEIVKEGENGYLYDTFCPISLSNALNRFLTDFKQNKTKSFIYPSVKTTIDYTKSILDIYKNFELN